MISSLCASRSDSLHDDPEIDIGIDDEEFPEDEDAAPPADDGIHNTGFDDESDGDHKSDDDSNSHVTTSMASGTGAGPAGGAVGTLGDDEDDGPARDEGHRAVDGAVSGPQQ